MLESRMIMNNPCLITETLNWLYLKMSEYIYEYIIILYIVPQTLACSMLACSMWKAFYFSGLVFLGIPLRYI